MESWKMAGNKRIAIVLMGSPGSGKTTLARGLAEHRPLSIIEVGSLLKREVQRGTTLGETIRPFTTTGKLVPLECVEAIISKEVAQAKEDLVLFDGIPRSTTQIASFLQLLADHELELGAVIVLTLDLQTALDRLTGRLVCQKCGALYNVAASSEEPQKICAQCGGKLVQRDDDREEVVQARFRRFERETVPVIDFFEKKFSAVTWEQSATTPKKERIDRVWGRLQKIVLNRDEKL